MENSSLSDGKSDDASRLRNAVSLRYSELIKEQANSHDIVFIGGNELKGLDTSVCPDI
jgi:hypothetical protein